MQTIYMIGGGHIRNLLTEPINKKAFGEAGGKPRILVFPWTTEDASKAKEKMGKMKAYFEEAGAKSVVFANEADENIEKIMKKTDIIYLPGGNPSILIDRIITKGLRDALKDYDRIIMGNSAGALAICEKYAIIKGQDDEKESKLVKGLGLTEITVSVHYKSAIDKYYGKEAEKELSELSTKTGKTIYAIPEESAILIHGSEIEFLGKIAVFENGESRFL